DRGVEGEPDAVLVVDRAHALVQQEVVLADVEGRRAGPAIDVAREAEDRGQRLTRKDLERRVVDVARAVVGVLARDDAVVDVRVREGGKRAEEIGPAPAEVEPKAVDLSGGELEHSRRAGAHVVRVDAEVVERVEGMAGRPGQRTQQDARTLVDLRSVHVVVAGDVDEPVAELELDREGLRDGRLGEDRRGGEREGENEKEAGTSRPHGYLRKCSERFEPWIATWHVVQLR